MLPTFIIGLREGLEAALIVGIVAAFLVRQGRRNALRQVWAGVGLAVVICLGVGVALDVLEQSLPQQGQEALETLIGLVAVALVTFMILWMRRHARTLRGGLEASVSNALQRGSTRALVLMAFLAVFREGFETAVFLLATFQASLNRSAAMGGAVLGIAVAGFLGYGIYKGGTRINLKRFFTVTATVLVVVAAGLLMTAAHTAHEAGWVNFGQSELLDLSWLVQPGTPWSSIVTGVLGIQPRPTVIEALLWSVYLAVMLAVVLRQPRGRRTTGSALAVVLLAGCGGTAVGGSATVQGALPVSIPITDDACAPSPSMVAAGPVNFELKNTGSTAVTEAEVMKGESILGEKENLAPGLSGSFSLRLEAGSYTVYCPNARSPRSTLSVTRATSPASTNAAQAQLVVAVRSYRAYVEGKAAALVPAVEEFAEAVRAGDLARARQLFPVARGYYEAIEPVAESFGDLDPEIDARINDVAAGARWTGFHRIEKALWEDGTTKGMETYADKLVVDVKRLDSLVQTVTLQGAQIANGAVDLLGEVANSKITGEEDRYSHTDLYDFEANVAGVKAAIDALTPAMKRVDPKLQSRIEQQFAAVDSSLDEFRSGTGFVAYTTTAVPDAKRRELTGKVNVLAETLSKVAPAIA